MKKLVLCGAVFLLLSTALKAFALPDEVAKPFDLQCDALSRPLGDDNKQPLFSWKLRDTRTGARQTAYRILVASDARMLASGRSDVWDSGRVASDRSVDIAYAGPVLQPETRYYWRVQAWDMRGKPYSPSEASWWETGLLGQEHWVAQWVGYEDQEQRSVREAGAEWITNPGVNPEVQDPAPKGATHHEFRLRFDVRTPVKRAILYVTGEAWVNGTQVAQPGTQPAWGRTPWRTYVRQNVTVQVHPGANLLAIEVTRFGGNASRTPMNATVYLEGADGSAQVLKTGTPQWKAMFQAEGNWTKPDYDDSSWPAAVAFPPGRDPFGGKDTLGSPLPTASVAALRHSFRLTKPVASARLYATAFGSYKFSVNGKPVGDQVLAPGWTDFRQRVYYQTYDVTALLAGGENALGAYLAPGWYSTPLEWIGQGNNYGPTPGALRAQLKVTYADGTSEWIATDSSWKADISPITSAEIYDGETYDARRLQTGWDRPGFIDAGWHPVSVIQPHEPAIEWQSFQPIRATRTVAPKSVTNPKPGVFIYDFGQNLAGVAKISLHASAGVTVQLRFAELLNSDGTLYVENLRNAKATDRYTFATDGMEEYEPSFTFHGFRYVELSGVTESPGLAAVQAVVLRTDYPLTAELKTGSSMINQLWSNIVWGQQSNFLSVPTDCPQRDERLGWAADAQVFWRTASFNAELTAFSRKYATDLRGTQSGTAMYGIYAPGTAKENPGYGPGWSDVGVIVPWTSWIQNGDKEIVRQNWDGMERYLSAILSSNPDYLWKNKRGINFGDWVAPEGPTSEVMIATAYWAYDATLMKQMAHAIGRYDDERKYSDLFLKIQSSFIHTWVHPNGRVEAEHRGNESEADRDAKHLETQTGYALALHMRLLPDAMRAQAGDRLVELIGQNGWKLGTGFLGTPYLLEVLTDTGHADVAYRILMNTEYPSWGYMVTHGATTMWERWNGDKMLDDPMARLANGFTGMRRASTLRHPTPDSTRFCFIRISMHAWARWRFRMSRAMGPSIPSGPRKPTEQSGESPSPRTPGRVCLFPLTTKRNTPLTARRYRPVLSPRR
jgi:alpha-L-rhamnosidase